MSEKSVRSENNTGEVFEPNGHGGVEDEHHEIEDGGKDEADTSMADEDTEDEDSDQESEEEDEDPPMLRYSRIDQLPKTFFSRESVSSILINEHCFAFGTSSGLLHVTDTKLKALGTIRARKSPILSIHTDGHHIIAASMDGTVLIAGIQDLHSTTAYDLKTPVYSVVLNRDYKETKSFIYGTKAGHVIISTTNWIGTRTERVISEENSPIVKMELMRNILIWMSDGGITFYDLRNDTVVAKIRRPNVDTPAELCWPRVSLPERDLILVGWFNHIWLIKCDDGSLLDSNFKLSSAMSSFSKAYTEPHVSIESEMDLEEGIIVGVGNLKGDLIVLTVDSLKITSPPELRIIHSMTHEETSTDEVILKGYSNIRANDIFLGQYTGDRTRLFIVSSGDGIMAQEYDLMGRFDWYLERSKFLKAWEMSEHLVSKEVRCNIGIKQVEAYLEDVNWSQAALFLSQVLDKCDTGPFLIEKWEQWSWIFIHSGKILNLVPIMPTSGLLLPRSIYNSCLEYLMDNDAELFFHYTTEWDTSLYDHMEIEEVAEQKLKEQPNLTVIRRSLANLYIKTQDPMKAVTHFIYLKSDHTVQLLEKYHLLPKFFNEIPTIIKYITTNDELKEAPLDLLNERLDPLLSLLVGQRHEISPTRIIPLLNDSALQVVTFLYLQRITKIDVIMSEFYETELMSLYAELAPKQLLPYLKKAQHYDIDIALKITTEKELYPELVYLLGKVGQTSKAMHLIIDKLDDPELGIEFATTHQDPKLWDIFLDQGVMKPKFIKTILQYTGTLFDVDILQNIPEGMEIEGLKPSLERIMQDNELVHVIHKVILSLIEKEGTTKAKELDDLRWAGRVMEG